MQINLLPEQLKKKKTTQVIQDIKKLILSFVVVWLILGSLWLILTLTIGGFKKKLSKIDVDSKTTESLLKDIDTLIQHKKELNEFLIFLKQHFKKGISWSEKLTSLASLVPEEIWLNEIFLRKEKKEEKENTFLDVWASVGYLKTDEEMLDKINSFAELIKNDNVFFKDFDNLSLFEIRKAGDKEKFMNFKFSLSIKQEP